MLNKNICLMTDSYKASHFEQYPDGTDVVYSYIEARGGKFKSTLFFGLQMFLKEYLTTPVTMNDVNIAASFFRAHGEPFNYAGWKHIVEKHHGRLPVRIKAVPEGTIVPVGNVLVTIENTDPKCYWLTSYLETALLRAVWYPTTVATTSYEAKKIIKKYLDETCDTPAEELPFKLHDFGARGVSSAESAQIGGAAHLVNFLGSDTVEGVLAANHYYRAEMAGFSIPAAEHSTMTMYGPDNEVAAFTRMLDKFGGPDKLVAVVSDSYDIYNAVEHIWGETLRDKVINMGGRVVIRPDSGEPTEVVPKVLQLLEKKFGTTINNKGYKVLHPAVRVIQGDGITIDSIPKILEAVKAIGFSTENVGFGMGGGLLQHTNRDVQMFAMKASYAEINGKAVEVYKKPATDNMKASKAGRLALTTTIYGNFFTNKVTRSSEAGERDLLWEVFHNGHLIEDYRFEEVRARASVEF